MHNRNRCFWIIPALVVCILLSGCQKKAAEPETTTLRLNEDGTVTQTIIGELEEGLSVSGLTAYIEELIADYNKEDSETPPVSLEGITEKENDTTVRIILSYVSLEDYASFNQVDAFAGSVAEAYQNGYRFGTGFTTESGSGFGGYRIPAEYPSLSVLVLKEAMNVIIPESAILVSDDITINEDGSYTIAASPAEEIPEVFQSVNSSCSYLVFKENTEEKQS